MTLKGKNMSILAIQLHPFDFNFEYHYQPENPQKEKKCHIHFKNKGYLLVCYFNLWKPC